jgi:hypothetical protein
MINIKQRHIICCVLLQMFMAIIIVKATENRTCITISRNNALKFKVLEGIEGLHFERDDEYKLLVR